MRIAANLVLLFSLVTFQYCYAFSLSELIEESRVHEMELSVSRGKATGWLYFDKNDRFGYCLINYIELDEVPVKKNIVPMKFIARTSCEKAGTSNFTVDAKGINKSNEEVALSILRRIVNCSSVNCFEKSPYMAIIKNLLPIYPSDITFDKNEFVVRAAMPHIDMDYYFYFNVDGRELTHVDAVESFAPDDAEPN